VVSATMMVIRVSPLLILALREFYINCQKNLKIDYKAHFV
jgi:hypothetical protein